MTQLKTASHDLGLGTKFGSTPEYEVPSTSNMNALEVLGEGILLLLTGDTSGGTVTLYLEDGREVRLRRGPWIETLIVTGI
jgi:hypothetical protein